MKHLIKAFAFLILISCNNENKTDTTADANEKTGMVNEAREEDIATITPEFVNVDNKIKQQTDQVVEHYLHIKNALVNGNTTEVSGGAKAMADVLQKMDKSYLTPDQKKVYDQVENNLKEQTRRMQEMHDIESQRSYFSLMSGSVYTLARAFGGGKTLYHDHCPMAFDNKGAMWLSESKEIRNPYYGDKMLKCGTVEEIIQQ